MAELNSVKVNCFISLPGEGFRTASAVPEQKLQIILKEIFFFTFLCRALEKHPQIGNLLVSKSHYRLSPGCGLRVLLQSSRASRKSPMVSTT